MNTPLPAETDCRFLVIDDDLTLCMVLERSLKRRGYSVATANDRDSALKVAKEYQPTHAIVDLKLGKDSGLHLIEPLLELNQTMQILMLTGYGSIPTAVDAVKAGAVNYLAKPVDIETILASFGKLNKESQSDEESDETPTPMSLKRLEWEHIQRVLEEHDGNISAAARSLNMHRRTLQRKLQKRPVKR